MTDQIVPSSTQNAPYYDDYNEDKQFYRILFRPGYAVQARELTQLQTILQKQIQRFGQHVFENGSMVTGGHLTYQGETEKIKYINLQSTFASTAIVANNFVGKTIEIANTVTGNARGYVLAAEELNSSEPPTLIIKPLDSLTINANDTIRTIETTPIFATTATANVSGNSSVISVDDGVYFYNGYFAKVLPQTIILDKYGNKPTYRVGLEFDDSIITSDSDTSLLDPAQEATNYQAPGASRYKVDLVLSKRTNDSEDDTKFVNLFVIDNGQITQKVNYPLYSELEKTLARRTFDESGSYTVRPFIGGLLNHISEKLTGNVSSVAGSTTITGNGTKFLDEISVNSIVYSNNQTAIVSSIASNISLTTSNTIAYGITAGAPMFVANPNKFTFQLSPGKAYVKGFEFETIAPTNLSIKRGRSYANVSSYDLYSPQGNYLFVSSANGIPDIASTALYDVHVTDAANINLTSTTAYSNTKIGTVRIRGFEYSSAGASGNAKTYIYKAYVSSANIANATFTLASAKALANLSSTTAGAYNPVLTIDASSKSNNNINGNTVLQETGFTELIFPYPQQFIVPSSISGVDYRFRRFASGVAFNSGTATLTLTTPETFYGSGSLADSDKLANWIVTVTDKKSSGYSNGDILPMLSANGRTVTISGAGATATLADGSNTFTASVVYTVDISGTAPSPRTKSRINANTTVIPTVANSYIANSNTSVFTSNGVILVTNANNVVKQIGVPQSLYISDVIRISKVLDFGANNFTTANITATTTTDLTNNFYLDNGQRDSYYDHASILLKPGYPAPTGTLAIFVDYYTHAGTSGYLTVDSYPSVGTNQGYANVATYTSPSTGHLFYLRDCIDWRPKRANGSETWTLVDSDSGTTSYVLQPGTTFTSSFSYYLSRVDKIVLTKDRQFKVIEGVADLYPQTPVHDAENDMLLYTLNIPAYTTYASDVDVRYNENKRYTMRDIGRLEKRIENLEYYASLNLLEKDAESLTILDSTGLNRFKNGIIVDSFNGHKIGDVQSSDYICAMDFDKGELWPSFTANNSKFSVNTGGSSNIVNKNGYVMLNYTEASYITQNTSTGTTPVNDFGYARFISGLQLYPDNDTWYDRNKRPLVLVNAEGENDAYEASSGTGFGTRYNEWSAGWAGLPVSTVQPGENQYYPGYELIDQGVSRTTDSTTTKQARSMPTPANSPSGIKDVSGDVTQDYSVVPYIREIDVIVRGVDVMPSTVFYPFFDNKLSQPYWINPTAITLTNVSGEFFSNSFETITSSSGGTAVAVLSPKTASVTDNTVINIISVVKQNGFINIGDTITGSISGSTATVSKVLAFSANVTGINANTYKINIASTFANTSNTAPVNSTISIVKGAGKGQVRSIASYDNVAGIITLSKAWDTAPDTTSVYNIYPATSTRFGAIAGVFAIPANTFVTGEKTLRLTTSVVNSTTSVASYADGKYFASGRVSTDKPVVQPTPTPPSPPTVAPEVPSPAPAPSPGYVEPSPPAPSDGGYVDFCNGCGASVSDIGSDGGGGGGGGDGGDCFTADSLVEMEDGSLRKISEVKLGEKVMNRDRTEINEVKFIEILPDTFWEVLYTPDEEHEPFATINHPLYIDGELAAVNANYVNRMYPWLGIAKNIAPKKTTLATGGLVYNLWVDGDGTYTVNGYGTTSIVGDGSWVRKMYERGLFSHENIMTIMTTIARDNPEVLPKLYNLNKLLEKADNGALDYILAMSLKVSLTRNIAKFLLLGAYKPVCWMLNKLASK